MNPPRGGVCDAWEEEEEPFSKLKTIVCGRLWHQATLALEELVKAPCFSAVGNKELLELYKGFLQDQPSSAPWSGFACKISPVKHASLAIVISKQYNGGYIPSVSTLAPCFAPRSLRMLALRNGTDHGGADFVSRIGGGD